MSEPEETLVDQLAILRAQLDQMISLTPELARTAKAWYDGFLAEGFTEKQSLYLAAAQMLQNPGTPPG